MKRQLMAAGKILEEIARCDREIAEMEQQLPGQPAYLTTLGIEDWKAEKRILQRLAATSGPM